MNFKIQFLKELVQQVLQPPDMEINIEKVNCPLVSKLKDSTVPHRATIVRFLDAG